MTRFMTRLDDRREDAARFYFSSADDANAFAACYGASVAQSSPATANGGLWRVVVPYSNGSNETQLPTAKEQMMAAIAVGRMTPNTGVKGRRPDASDEPGNAPASP